MTRKKNIMAGIIPPLIVQGSTSVTASNIKIIDEKEFIYPDAYSSKDMVASLAYELGTEFKPKTKRKIIEVMEVAKSQITDFQVGLNLEEGFYIKIKREPQKIIKIFKEIDE
jgi:hypothetical protein